MKILKVLAVLAVVVVIVGGALYWFVIKSDPEREATLRDRGTETTEADSSGESSGESSGDATLEGTWTAEAGAVDDVFVGYRVDEVLGGLDQTVTGRTNEVTGSFTIEGTSVTEGEFTADVSTLSTGNSNRDNAARRTGLGSSQFPDATFVLTEPIDLDGIEVGDTKRVEVVGDLTVRDVTLPVTFTLDARWNGDSIDLAGSAPITLDDFGIDVSVFDFAASVENDAVIELQLTFVKG